MLNRIINILFDKYTMKNKTHFVVGLLLGSFALEGCGKGIQDIISTSSPFKQVKGSHAHQRKHSKKTLSKNIPLPIPPAPPAPPVAGVRSYPGMSPPSPAISVVSGGLAAQLQAQAA